MLDFLTAAGLVLVIEGTLYALFPDTMKRAAEYAMQMPSSTLRVAGLVAAGFGVLFVWLVRA